MKKTYTAPTLEEHKIARTQIICVSGQLDPEQTITTPEGVGARAFDEFEGF